MVRIHLVLFKCRDQIIKRCTWQHAGRNGRLQCYKHRMGGQLRLRKALMQHPAPLTQQPGRQRGIPHLISQIIRGPAERIHAVEMRLQLRRQKERRHMEVLVVCLGQVLAPGLRLGKAGPLRRRAIPLRRAGQRSRKCLDSGAHASTSAPSSRIALPSSAPCGNTTVLISGRVPSAGRVSIRSNSAGTSSRPAELVRNTSQ